MQGQWSQCTTRRSALKAASCSPLPVADVCAGAAFLLPSRILGLMLELEFSGEIWYWRGPAPFHFVTVPDEGCSQIQAIATAVSYGWGVIPVTVEIGRTKFTTSLFPKDGKYLLPLKDAVRKAERLSLGDRPMICMTVGE